MAEMLPHVWDTRGGFLSFTSIADISTALMRPRRPKQYCLQLVIYIYTFNLRYRNHICSFRNERYKHATELSKYIWSLKDQKIASQIKWRKIKQAMSYSNVSKRCNLCLWEKFFILRRPEMSILNSRNELTSGCRYARKFLLKNVLF